MQQWKTFEHPVHWKVMSFVIGQQWEMSTKMLRTAWSKEAPLKQQTWIDLWHVLLQTWDRTRVINAGRGNTWLIWMPKDGWKHSTSRLSAEVYFLRYNNADIYWYMRMSTDPPPADPKVETLPQLCKEERATLEPTFPCNRQLPHQDG